MPAKILISALLLSALVAGVAIYYLQVYAFYEEVTLEDAGGVQMQSLATGLSERVEVTGFEAIDSDSSPLRFRACFDVVVPRDDLSDSFATASDTEPRVAPGWFDCFDAQIIGEAVESGEATVFMGRENIEYGIDRVIAVMPDGRGYSWHEINACGEVVFDGNPVPEGCPDPDTFVPEGN